jgi:broad specificity phosphatase PhoE
MPLERVCIEAKEVCPEVDCSPRLLFVRSDIDLFLPNVGSRRCRGGVTWWTLCSNPAANQQPKLQPDSTSERSSMTDKLPALYLARHGNTAWTHTGQHTGLTNLPLTSDGERNAVRLGERLKGMTFTKVFTSPLQRAARTCELAGFGAIAEVDPDLVEWDYGNYEGLTSAQILQQRPDWDLFRDGCPGGESPQEIGERAARMVKRIRSVEGDVLLFSSGHFIRVLAACWMGFGAGGGRYFVLAPASLSALSYEHNMSRPAIRLWNDDSHVEASADRVLAFPREQDRFQKSEIARVRE